MWEGVSVARKVGIAFISQEISIARLQTRATVSCSMVCWCHQGEAADANLARVRRKVAESCRDHLHQDDREDNSLRVISLFLSSIF